VEGTGGASRGEVVLATDGLEPGPWEALLLGADGEELSRSPFWLYEPGAPVEVEATKASFRPAEPVTFTWRNTPGNRWDWVGLYKATEDAVPTDGGIADDSGDYLYYEYTRTEIEGAGRITASSQAGAGKWPLAPGRYELRLLLDDGYGSVARSQPFTVAP
jgi:hypothetical protein